MNLSEKRQDAAHTLVVPYDATPDVVNQAYVCRLAQRFRLQNLDIDAYNRGNDKLYDARVRMETPENKQWRAQLRLMATGHVEKMIDALMVMISLVYHNNKSVLNQVLIDDLLTEIPKVRRKYNAFRGVCAYEIGGFLGMMAYNNMCSYHSPAVSLAFYTSMMAGVLAIGLLHDSMRRSTTKIFAWSKLLSYDNTFSKVSKER